MNANALLEACRSYAPASDAFAGRVILVTGATAGIGRAVARDLVRHGATVILHGRSEKALEALYQELRPLGPEPAVAQVDLERAQGPQYQSLTSEIEARYGRLDGVLHNAAILGDRSPIEHYDIGLWQRVLLVNLTAPFILTRCLLPLLRKSEDASVLFTTSAVGQRGRAYWGAYAVSKAGLEGLAEVLADELESTPIRVNLINPGGTRTRMRARAYPAENPETLPTAESITPAFLYLLGPASRGVRGQRVELRPPTRP
ncbi:MAG TPA: YciK family oxidoreductase [Gammaproteobacteria bacterium]|jgi:NAD(P)-dependent dehydrogenase (short-subunit alcohol dehydrogenase family)|nr:YciK family oxidoreductase [Gammaproteobacteria bacterium]